MHALLFSILASSISFVLETKYILTEVNLEQMTFLFLSLFLVCLNCGVKFSSLSLMKLDQALEAEVTGTSGM